MLDVSHALCNFIFPHPSKQGTITVFIFQVRKLSLSALRNLLKVTQLVPGKGRGQTSHCDPNTCGFFFCNPTLSLKIQRGTGYMPNS